MEHQEDTQPKHRNSLWMQQDVYQKTQVDGVTVDVNYFKAIINPGTPNQVVINRPQLTYAEILHDIISEMPNKRISTVNIYDKVVEIYPYFKYATARWRNSINSVLSRNTQFRSVTYHDERGLPDRYWTIVEPNNENDNKTLLENIMSTNNNNGLPIASPSPSHQPHQQSLPTSPHLHNINVNHQHFQSIPANNTSQIGSVRSFQHIQDTPPYIVQNDFAEFCSRALGINYSDICNNEEKLNMAYSQYILYMNGVRNSAANMPSHYARPKYIPPPPNMVSTNPYMNVDWSSSQIPVSRPASNIGTDPTNIQPQFQYPAIGQALQHYMQYIPTNQDQQVPPTSASSNAANEPTGINNIYTDYAHSTDPNSGHFALASGTGASMALPNYGNYHMVDEQQVHQFFPPNQIPPSYGKENLIHRSSMNLSPLPTVPNNSLHKQQHPQFHQQQFTVGPHVNFPPLSQISSNNTSQNPQLDLSNSIKNSSLVDSNFDVGDISNYDPNNSIDMSNQIVDR